MSAAQPRPVPPPAPVGPEKKTLVERERDAELSALDQAERQRARRAVEAAPADLPRMLWEAHVNHARAMFDRHAAEDEVRDALQAYRDISIPVASPLVAEATYQGAREARMFLAGARQRYRTALYCEHLALGTLEAVRARVELTTGGKR